MPYDAPHVVPVRGHDVQGPLWRGVPERRFGEEAVLERLGRTGSGRLARLHLIEILNDKSGGKLKEARHIEECCCHECVSHVHMTRDGTHLHDLRADVGDGRRVLGIDPCRSQEGFERHIGHGAHVDDVVDGIAAGEEDCHSDEGLSPAAWRVLSACAAVTPTYVALTLRHPEYIREAQYSAARYLYVNCCPVQRPTLVRGTRRRKPRRQTTEHALQDSFSHEATTTVARGTRGAHERRGPAFARRGGHGSGLAGPMKVWNPSEPSFVPCHRARWD